MKRVGWLVGVLLVLTAVVTICFVNAMDNSVRIELTDSTGKPITTALPNSKVFVNIWTFDDNGSIVNLQSEELKAGFLSPSNTVILSDNTIQKVKEFAKKRGSLTAFIGVDVAILDEKGKLWTFPPTSFEIPLKEKKDLFAILNKPKTIKLKLNIKEAKVTDLDKILPKEEKLTSKNFEPLYVPSRYEWRTMKDISLGYTDIPVLIIKNNRYTDVRGAIEMGYYYESGPKLSVAFGYKISDSVKFDPDKIEVKILDRTKTDYYKAGKTVDVDRHHYWGYIYVEAKPHYIFRKEYFCYYSRWSHRWICFETGNEEHLVKIDDFKIDHITGRIKVIKSRAKLEKPSFGIPSSDYATFTNNLVYQGDVAYLEDFLSEIYPDIVEYRLGIGIPVGASIKFFRGCEVPCWLDAITVSIDCLGLIENDGPHPMYVHSMKSKNEVEVKVTGWNRTQIPLGFYVEISSCQ